jgi:hypothetical protein
MLVKEETVEWPHKYLEWWSNIRFVVAQVRIAAKTFVWDKGVELFFKMVLDTPSHSNR